MDRTERFYRIDQLLNEQGVVTLDTFLAELGVSRATFKRDMEYLRDRLHAPITWDRDAGGYCFASANPAAPKYELPGLWFNASEIHALLTMQHLLENLGPGLLAHHVQPLLARLGILLESADIPRAAIEKRIRILRATARAYEPQHFSPVASAVLQRKQLRITYYSRDRDETLERNVSPQRLTHYRDNWYLDAWCHLRDGLRSFALDAIENVALLDAAAADIPDTELDAVLGAGYGIFSGKEVKVAELRFTPERARWVSRESWHPNQEGRFDETGNYLLKVPYSDDRELLMDILKHGSQVEVLAPADLRLRIAAELQATTRRYA